MIFFESEDYFYCYIVNAIVLIVGLALISFGFAIRTNFLDMPIDLQIELFYPYIQYIIFGLVIIVFGLTGIIGTMKKNEVILRIQVISLKVFMALIYLEIVYTSLSTPSIEDARIIMNDISFISNIKAYLNDVNSEVDFFEDMSSIHYVLRTKIWKYLRNVENIRWYYSCIGLVELIGFICVVSLLSR